jgi:SAM-dependent methyltransferase
VATGDDAAVAASNEWRAELEAWRIDDDILAAAPESPYQLPPEHFHHEDRDRSTVPTTLVARQALLHGGSVLDVGCGAGAASLPLFPPGTSLVGVDTREPMLTAFLSAAETAAIDASAVLGRWPDVAERVGPADVVVSANVVYDVPDLAEFVGALATHARRRVVLEFMTKHPWVPIGPLWQEFHHQDRPTGPSFELAIAVLAEVGITGQIEHWTRPPRLVPPPRADQVAMIRRRLCLPREREPEVDALLGEEPRIAVDGMVTVWWDA